MRSRAFTLIELLVVIAIIGLLSSVILASLNSARQKAQYTAVASDLQEAYTAFYAWSLDLGAWPGDGGNRSVATLISSYPTGLGKYLPSAPQWPFSSNVWSYDNDGDSRSPASCTNGSYSSGGVNLFIYGATEDQYEALDKILDGDANPNTATARSCGKIIYDPNGVDHTLVFVLSNTQ